MKEPGLDGRHRDRDGEIQKKRGDTLNRNLSQPIPEFRPDARLDTIRKATGQVSIEKGAPDSCATSEVIGGQPDMQF